MLDEKELRAAYIAKLAESGFTEEDGKRLKFKKRIHNTTKKLCSSFDPRGGFVLPYFDLNGRENDFYRFRYLEESESKAGWGASKPLSRRRYTQPPGQTPRAYYPPIFPRPGDWTWAKVRDNLSLPVMITEGELKAAAGTALGRPTIGLGGVWNFTSKKAGKLLIDDLKQFKWKADDATSGVVSRRVDIIFDSDAATNTDVQKAMVRLADILTDEGATVYTTFFPNTRDLEKTGLDDFIVAMGSKAFEAIKGLLENSELYDRSAELQKYNSRFAWIMNPGASIISLEDGALTYGNVFAERTFLSNWGNEQYGVESDPDSKGITKIIKKKIAKDWKDWPARRNLASISYLPGKPVITDNFEYNTWQPNPVTPKQGSVKPWRTLIDFLFEGADDGAIQWFESWCAYQFQKQGSKLYTAVLLHGARNGSGKSLVGETLGALFGSYNFARISNEDLRSGYNDWAQHTQFVLGDEIVGSDKRNDISVLKRLVTQESVRISIKYVPAYAIPDCMNYLFTSNYGDAFYLDDFDRRFFVQHVNEGNPLDQSFYDKYEIWMKSDKGQAALLHYFLEYDCGEFHPKSKAMTTTSKFAMIASVKTDVDEWVSRLKEYPEEVMTELTGSKDLNSDLWTARELLTWYQKLTDDTRLSAQGLGRKMSSAGFFQTKLIKTMKGAHHWWAIRNTKRWRTASNADIRTEVARSRGMSEPEKGKY